MKRKIGPIFRIANWFIWKLDKEMRNIFNDFDSMLIVQFMYGKYGKHFLDWLFYRENNLFWSKPHE